MPCDDRMQSVELDPKIGKTLKWSCRDFKTIITKYVKGPSEKCGQNVWVDEGLHQFWNKTLMKQIILTKIQKKKKNWNKGSSIHGTLSSSQYNTCKVIRVPEMREREKERERERENEQTWAEEILKKQWLRSFQNQWTISTHWSKLRTLSRTNTQKHIPLKRYKIKLIKTKHKKKILKADRRRERVFHIQERTILMMADFSSETWDQTTMEMDL